ncbi:hypothetical protein CBR_g45329 [Chara braunii]|uniref:Reverse transcriptase RNase H-like domain-containing protein n=1 Tax=Chara braunii TaxID=69332 RepID=A0A388LYI3_CHABU|nr:hypothetical protein CBR_g45329 [Chara braunii]|eukprot:GBG87269.1 hypothetical protein CBR_g45329 [Chara braunii]
MTSSVLGMPGQLANESIAEYRQRFETQLALIAVEEQRQLAAEAVCLQAEAAATAEKQRLQAEADADTQARRKEARDLLQRHEATSIEKLKFWHFEPSEGHDDATPEEQYKEFMAKLVTRLVYTCNHLQSELANLQRAVRNHKAHHEDVTGALDSCVQDLEQTAPRPEAGESSSAPSARQLEERVDHVVAMLGDISTFAAPATISQQLDTLKTEIRQRQQPSDLDRSTSTAKHYKMPTFRIEKFDDYTHQDPVVWWQGFTTELGIHEVPEHLFIGALFLNTKGGCQIWLSHMATVHGVQVFDLHKKVSWEDLTKEWKKRFIVDDARRSPSTASSRWLKETQRRVRTGPRPQHVAAVQTDNIVEDPAATQASREGDQVAAVQPRSNNKVPRKREGENPIAGQKRTASTMGQVSLDRGGIQVTRPLRLLLLVQQHQAQDLPMPGSRQGGCSASYQLRKLSSAGVPTPLMDARVEVVDLHAYIAKIDREFKTQRYDDIDAPLLFVRIQIGEATCSTLIDCGASRNYMSQDFIVRAGLGPRVRRKSQPTQVTLADGHMHKSIDRCIDDVPVYFAPHASEAVSFDILDTKFGMILHMSWLRSEDHPVNFYRRTVHVRDRNGVLVPCTVPPPHPSISCHVVSAASMRASIIRDDIEEMGVCFLHALPPHDASSTDSSSDPRITELLDAYGDVRSLGEHVEHLRTVLERLRQAKYKANRDVLEQHDGNDWHPMEYFSHKVPPINSLDDARKKELLAFVMALKQWRHFLLGRRRFTWVTDNNLLTYYKTQDTVSITIGRCMYFIDQFDFTPKHLPGLSNRAADALSRRPDLCAMTHHAFAFDEELQRHFIRGYESDPDFATLYAQLSSDHPPASRVHRSVVGELDVGEAVNPIFLVGTDERTNHHLSGLMCPLRLPVCLWMPSRTWFHLRVELLHESSPKCRHEASVAVADYVFRYNVAATPTGVQEACQLGSRGVVLAREKTRILTQTVHNREDAVVPEAIAGKWSSDIHGNGEAGFPWDRHRAQLAVGIAIAGLASSANFARVAIPSDIGNEVGPSESLSKPCNSAVDSEMAGESRVMVLPEKASPKTTVSWDTQ